MTKMRQVLLALVALLALSACGDDDNGTTTPTPDAGDVANNDDDAANNDCPEGQLDCPCTPSGTCGGDLVCENGVCAEPEEPQLAVSDPEARACEVLLEESGSTVVGVEYGDGVRGVWRRRAPNVALAFVRESDEAFDAGVLGLRTSGPETGVHIKSVHCVDRLGQPLTNVEVDLGSTTR